MCCIGTYSLEQNFIDSRNSLPGIHNSLHQSRKCVEEIRGFLSDHTSIVASSFICASCVTPSYRTHYTKRSFLSPNRMDGGLCDCNFPFKSSPIVLLSETFSLLSLDHSVNACSAADALCSSWFLGSTGTMITKSSAYPIGWTCGMASNKYFEETIHNQVLKFGT